MASTNYTHVYATLQGEWKSGNVFSGEMAQIGFRIATWSVGTNIEIDAPLPIRPLKPVYKAGTDTLFDYMISWEGDETASVGSQEVVWGEAEQQDIATKLWNSITANWKTKQSSKFQWTGLKLSPIDPLGKAAQPASQFVAKTPVAGAGSATMPAETSVAVTMRTPILGRRGRGRVYVPGLSSTALDPAGTVESTAAQIFGTGVSTFITDVRDNMGGVQLYRVIVTSAKSQRYVLPLTVSVGNLFDVQRRRQAQVDETYLHATDVS